MAMYVPKGQELLLRGPFMQDFRSPKTKNYSYTVPDSEYVDMKGLMEKSQPAKIAFYTRHNPHPVRVRHLKGLLDVPICCVEDSLEERILWSPPSGQDMPSVYYPEMGTRYGANKAKSLPAVGVVPVTSAWRDELEKMTHAALSKAMGMPPSSRGGRVSRPTTSQLGQRPAHLKNLEDQQIVDLLFRILQTDSVPACRAWLNSAADNEKNIVLNLLNMAASGEMEYASRPGTSASGNVRYSYWAPQQSRLGSRPRLRSHSYDATMNDPAADFNFVPLPEELEAAGLNTRGELVSAFRLPENDTVVHAARQLSALASRRGLRSSQSCDTSLGVLGSRRASRPPSAAFSHTGRPRSSSVSTIAPFQHDAMKTMSRARNMGKRENPGIFLPSLSRHD